MKKVLKEREPFKRMIYLGRGQKVRDMFDRSNLPRTEQGLRQKIKSLRQKIKKSGFWMR